MRPPTCVKMDLKNLSSNWKQLQVKLNTTKSTGGVPRSAPKPAKRKRNDSEQRHTEHKARKRLKTHETVTLRKNHMNGTGDIPAPDAVPDPSTSVSQINAGLSPQYVPIP